MASENAAGNESQPNVIYIHDKSLFDGLSLIAAFAMNASISIICFSLVASCLVYTLHRYLQRREERVKLCKIIATHYWSSEDQIALVVQLITNMRKVIIFREVTAFHILSYKYRYENGVYGTRDVHTIEKKILHPYLTAIDVFQILKKIERLFDSLMLQLTCKGKCPSHIASMFSSTLFGLAQVTSLVWCDEKKRGIRRLVCYFAGRESATTFDSGHISDADLESMVTSRAPYVGHLYLNIDHFVLKDVEISSEGRIDLKSKIRYVDTILAKHGKIVELKEKNIIESYYAAREICLKHGLIQSKSQFSDVQKFIESEGIGECAGHLRHLLRLMCFGPNIRKVENDESFFQFLMQLHETLYSWADEQTMLEVIERCRNNIAACLHGLTIEQILMDREFTKAKLEQIEKELYRHLNYLTIRQVQQEKEKRQQQDRLKDNEMRMHPAESESSVYTMALSTSSYALKRQTSQERPIQHQQSIDQGSIASGSSVYAPATLLSSISETLLQPSRTSPVSPKSGSRPASDGEGEFFETPV